MIEVDKPEPEECPECRQLTGYVWDEEVRMWVLDGEWWYSEVHHVRYADSRRCHFRLCAKALGAQGLTFQQVDEARPSSR